MELTKTYKLATFSFESTSNQNDIFGANGLPLTPSSITIVGNFNSFVRGFNLTLKHPPYLVNYLDCIRSKNEKITLVFEHHPKTAMDVELRSNDLESLLHCGLDSLYHLHYVIGCVHGLLTPEAFVCDSVSNFKLTHWAINLITNFGQLCQSNFYPNDIRFLSPEQLILLKPTRKSDVWSLGLSLLYLMFPKSFENFPSGMLDLVNCTDSKDVFKLLQINRNNFSDEWNLFFSAALHPVASKRASVRELIHLLQFSEPKTLDSYEKFQKVENYTNVEKMLDDEVCQIAKYIDVHEFYYLWCITYPLKETDKKGRKLPPILSVPRLVILENENCSQERCDNSTTENFEDEINKLISLDLEDVKTVKLPCNAKLKLLAVDTINERLLKLSHDVFSPLIVTENVFSKVEKHNSEFLPLPIREMDFDYQCERLMIFKHLINGFPFLRTQLIAEAKIDICPHYRAHIWAGLLNVRWVELLEYDKIDKISKTSNDRQIAVDIPRCHQYNDLLASAQGHCKLTRILKAWLAHNESNGEVYWQGLDSLAAPFVILNFNNEPQAFACFDRFVKKYLRGFFQKDNSAAIQEYLGLFQVVISFHDPLLSNHLASLKFVPDLYAISWFLTMFTHILPLYQVVQLWDTLILGNESFPLFIGLAILHQLRDRILDFSFNDCILIFSDLPQIDIDRCVRNSVKFFCATPKSITRRGYWPLEFLKEYSRLPRIDIDDLLQFVEKDSKECDTAEDCLRLSKENHFIIVDCRSTEEISTYGAFINSISFDDFCQELQKSSNDKNSIFRAKHNHNHLKNHLVVVVNSIESSMELIDTFGLQYICFLKLSTYVPKQLLA